MAVESSAVKLWWSELSPEDQQTVQDIANRQQPLPAHLVASLGRFRLTAVDRGEPGYALQLPLVVREFLEEQG